MVFCVVNRSCGETRGSSCSRRRKASIFSLGQSERLAKVRWRVFLPSRQPSRRRMAGGELRLGTTAIYMRTLTNINPNLSREIYSYMRTQINENQVAVRAKPHIFKILTSNRASTVGWNFGLEERSRRLTCKGIYLRYFEGFPTAKLGDFPIVRAARLSVTLTQSLYYARGQVPRKRRSELECSIWERSISHGVNHFWIAPINDCL